MRRLGFLASVALAAAGASGCTQSGASVYIQKVGALDEMCAVDTSSDGLLSGSWDVNAGGSYTVNLVVSNLLRQRTGPVATDPNKVVIDEVEVNLLDATGASLGSYTVPASGFIPSSADGITPGQGIVAAAVIPNAAKSVVGPAGSQVTLMMKVRGETLGTTNVESREFPFLVTIYRGQLAESQTACYPATGTATAEPSCDPGSNGNTYCPPCDPATPGVRCP